ncbi:MAG: sugar-transfer associated ATP-grasp domain-containing protein [Lachnospiraceae bacterium]|nr:sugar-transfer associated ATP-grasp domain-containing protein [Lachnospiraceae bacterium]
MSIIKKVLKQLILTGDDFADRLVVSHLRRGEVKKIKDKRRVEILKKTELSSEQKHKIDKLFQENYGEKIPYDWHRYFTAYTGNFDERYFPEILYVPEFEHFMNVNKSYCDVYADKNVIPLIAKATGIVTPETLFSCVYGMFRDRNNKVLSKTDFIEKASNIGNAFVKPSIDSSSGQGCAVIDLRNGKDIHSGKTVDELIEALGDNFVIQELVKSHKSISNIYPNSVNTFRVITYRWNSDIEVMPVIMRIGRGNSEVDNAHAGGIFIGVENDGTLKSTAFTEFRDTFNEHPNTHVVFKGYRIEHFDRIVEAAKMLHSTIPQLGIYNWDFTINEEGTPVLIEANTLSGSIWLAEMAHGIGVFGDKTEDVLKWIRHMKRLKKSNRM